LQWENVEKHTLINLLELRDDVQTNIGKVVLEHLKEHGKQMGNSPVHEMN
jgi:hypothetical protein